MTEPLPFVDLAAQQARIKPELDRRMAAVLAHGRYILGPEVAELEARLADFAGCAHAVAGGVFFLARQGRSAEDWVCDAGLK